MRGSPYREPERLVTVTFEDGACVIRAVEEPDQFPPTRIDLQLLEQILRQWESPNVFPGARFAVVSSERLAGIRITCRRGNERGSAVLSGADIDRTCGDEWQILALLEDACERAYVQTGDMRPRADGDWSDVTD